MTDTELPGEPPPLQPSPKSLPEPHTRRDIQAVLTHPFRATDLVFAHNSRLASTIVSKGLTRLVVALLYISVIFALPFGAVLQTPRLWLVSLLFIGSLANCLPSLHIFNAYVGSRVDFRQNAALALIITSVASLFTFGFFPILWFMKATIVEESRVTPLQLVIGLAGTLALIRQWRALIAIGSSTRASKALVMICLMLSLGVGGQVAFYLRPFFGIPLFWNL